MSEEYRQNVGIVVYNKNLKVLLCKRKGYSDDGWQFPQGGIDPGEDLLEAARRELWEETSVTSVTLQAVAPGTFKYKFPAEIYAKLKARGHQNIGQEQHWVLFYFYGDDSEINTATREPEFDDWKWADIQDAPNHIIAFKKGIYERIVEIFAPQMKK